MKFIKFLTSLDKKELAEKLGCSLDLVYKWSRRESYPKKIQAEKLIKISKGQLAYNDIYTLSKKEQKTMLSIKSYQEEKKKLDEQYKKATEELKQKFNLSATNNGRRKKKTALRRIS